MHSYFRDPEATAECLVDGWLDTGDMGYMVDGYLFIVGRAKDMTIINGKNHWPQDIEWAVTGEASGRNIYILQSRPETVWAARDAQPVAKPAASALEHVFAALGHRNS